MKEGSYYRSFPRTLAAKTASFLAAPLDARHSELPGRRVPRQCWKKILPHDLSITALDEDTNQADDVNMKSLDQTHKVRIRK